ncbi:hypothetical protein ACRALDRAFT_206869 [Sodiomyces alcalophilus JCM 7366]|uniref:uncharacterized protein n=1 Tax=Sodiomyces alcalophilus JCM 7366 TaxID=591952 RepID=UPI0039B6CFBC
MSVIQARHRLLGVKGLICMKYVVSQIGTSRVTKSTRRFHGRLRCLLDVLRSPYTDSRGSFEQRLLVTRANWFQARAHGTHKQAKFGRTTLTYERYDCLLPFRSALVMLRRHLAIRASKRNRSCQNEVKHEQSCIRQVPPGFLVHRTGDGRCSVGEVDYLPALSLGVFTLQPQWCSKDRWGVCRPSNPSFPLQTQSSTHNIQNICEYVYCVVVCPREAKTPIMRKTSACLYRGRQKRGRGKFELTQPVTPIAHAKHFYRNGCPAGQDTVMDRSHIGNLLSIMLVVQIGSKFTMVVRSGSNHHFYWLVVLQKAASVGHGRKESRGLITCSHLREIPRLTDKKVKKMSHFISHRRAGEPERPNSQLSQNRTMDKNVVDGLEMNTATRYHDATRRQTSVKDSLIHKTSL